MFFRLDQPLEPCLPPVWARSGHAQTIVAHYLPSPPLQAESEVLEIPLPGGDTLVAHHYPNKKSPGNKTTVVYVFHGLGGESHRPYMRRTAQLALDLGHAVILANHRGCGTGRGRAREFYHSGRAEDLSAVIAAGRKLYPDAIHLAIGFSLSANALLLLAAKQRAQILPDAAIAVNAPINLSRASELLLRGWNRLYDISFMQEMREAVQSRVDAGHEVHRPRLSAFATLRDFDDAYTAPASGFESREHYYLTCSADQYLKDICIPTVLLTAADDPFVSPIDYVSAVSNAPELVEIHVEPHGGHMGYLTRKKTPLGNHRWMDYALLNYMKALQF